MSFFLRKALRFGPIRFNLSKSGIGVSAGVKGLRIGTGPKGNYIHAGRGGLYYRKSLGRIRRSSSTAEVTSAFSEPTDLPREPGRVVVWPWLVLLSVIVVTLMAWSGMSQSTMAITANALLAACIVAVILARRRRSKASELEQAVWIDFDKTQSVAFLIAPIGNPAATKKLISLAGDYLQAQRKIAPAVYIEAMIGTVLLDWRGLTHEGKPFTFSHENARTLLSQSEAIRDFISETSLELDNQAKQASPSGGPEFISAEDLANRPKPKVIDTTAPPPESGARREPSLAEFRAEGGRMERVGEQIGQLENYTLPGLDLLNEHGPETRTAASLRELQRIQELLHERFRDFGIAVSPGAITHEAAAIRYEIASEKRLSSDEIAKLERSFVEILDTDWVRIVSQSDDGTKIDVNVSNAGRINVPLKQVLLSEEWEVFKAMAQLPIALGRDTNGKTLAADLSELPHMLIAGTTGSGKSACIDTVLASLLFKYSPEELRFIMIDLRFQMQIYGRLPHLAFPVISDPKKVLLGLRWLIDEMDRRYKIFARTGVRNIANFNAREIDRSGGLDDATTADDLLIPGRMPFIVVIIDDLADLMQTAPTDIENAIARIIQLARATGVYLLISTQMPRADVITGAIKANIPCRIAFKVASKLDSRVILDANGAERLLGEGDMLYLPPSSPHCIRAQGAFVTDQELKRIVDFISNQVPQDFHVPTGKSVHEDVTDEEEELVEKSLEIIRQEKRASTSLLQRRLRLGYTRSARIIDILEQRGILGPGEGANPREILVDLDAGI